MAFFAIPAPDEVKARISDVLAALKKDWSDVQWVHPEDYHFTLRFLGGLPEFAGQEFGQFTCRECVLMSR